jgi:hypothetical protein
MPDWRLTAESLIISATLTAIVFGMVKAKDRVLFGE